MKRLLVLLVLSITLLTSCNKEDDACNIDKKELKFPKLPLDQISGRIHVIKPKKDSVDITNLTNK